MNTNQNLFKKGLGYAFAAIPLFFLAPILANIGFSALKKTNTYWIIGLSAVLALVGIFSLFLGIQKILKAFFGEK